ncbi:hypothetical protein EC973_008305 [Apophysomyces ossiformis]|uniref:Arrestin C-terminal-like domain-containing protein n=1 Tax=Apophysomyces ossiformis TaxID=679940 RepID=A0A8H7BSR9_9FUNG|nr:hypothetical protein EC973_008305 [Apophysomyces ossiformis]
MNTFSQHKYKRSNSTRELVPTDGPIIAPDLRISLDLPTCADRTPSYLPGQDVTGQLSIGVKDPVEVLYLRVALFGHCQVYERPGHPLIHGMFDYLENRQLLNTGFRITRRANDGSKRSNSNLDAMALTGEQHPQQRQLLKKQEQHAGSQSTRDSRTDKHKARLNANVERLIRDIANTELGEGAHVSDNSKFRAMLSNAGKDTPFLLPSNAHQINFSLRISNTRNLPGTLDHRHFPIQYRVVAVMLCKHIQTGIEMTSYTSIPFKLEPHVSISADLRFASPLQTIWTSCRVGNTSWWNNLWPISKCSWRAPISNCSEDARSINDRHQCIRIPWLGRLFYTRNSSWLRIMGGSDTVSGHLSSVARLPRQAFVHGQPIPLQVELVNNSLVSIVAVSIHVELVQKILMTSHLGEPVESTIVLETKPLFRQGRDEVFRSKKMQFDLCSVLSVPEKSTCTISSESTRDTIEILHELQVKVYILQTISKDEGATDNQLEESIHKPVAEAENEDLHSLVNHNQYKLDTLVHSPLSIVIGSID